jgi:hypothetical protein
MRKHNNTCCTAAPIKRPARWAPPSPPEVLPLLLPCTMQVLTAVPAGLLKTVVQLDRSLLGGATVQVVAHLPRSTAPAPKVPTSAIFDPNAPTSLLAMTTLAVTEVSLTLSTVLPQQRHRTTIRLSSYAARSSPASLPLS